MATNITVGSLVKPGTPSSSRVSSPSSIRGQAGVKLFGSSLAGSIAGDLEGLSAAVNALYTALQVSPAVTEDGFTGDISVRNAAGSGTSTIKVVNGRIVDFIP
jgi:hypothetical protein